jgi:arylsulfatase A-like enzyme
VDLLATCAALVGAKLPPDAGEDSYNLLPVLRGDKLGHPVREATVLHSGGGKFAIRQDEWLLIDARSGDDNGKRGEPQWFRQEHGYTTNQFGGELYNLRDDLPQRRNLYRENPEVVQRLKRLLEQYKANGRSTPGPPQPNTPASTPRRASSTAGKKGPS